MLVIGETMEKEETDGNALDFPLSFAVNLKKLLEKPLN